MADKKPVKATYSGTDTNGLAEFTGTDTIGVVDGGTGLATVATDNILTGNDASALSAESNLTFDGSTLNVVGNAGVGLARTDGTLHVQSASAGSIAAAAAADELVLEGSAGSGLTILSGTSSTGSMFFGDSDGDQRGRIQYEHANDAFVFATAAADRMRIDSTGAITTPANPAFMCRYGGHHADATGDGTSVTLNGNTEVYDRNADYSTSTGGFTAPIAGLYQFSAGIYLEGLTSAHTSGYLGINSTNSGGIKTSFFNPWAIRSSNTVMVWTYDIVFNCAAGDVVTAVMSISGGTKVVDLMGSTNITNYFSGQLIG